MNWGHLSASNIVTLILVGFVLILEIVSWVGLAHRLKKKGTEEDSKYQAARQQLPECILSTVGMLIIAITFFFRPSLVTVILAIIALVLVVAAFVWLICRSVREKRGKQEERRG